MTPERGDAAPTDSLCLVVLDGWGLARPGPGNAVSQADTPVFDGLWERYPRTQLDASGRDVGLPEGQMGNSEVGHLNLGAGAVVKQDLTRIDDAVADGSLFENEVLLAACEAARSSPRGRLHLLGLVSDGGVHSGWTHIEALIELAAQEGVPDVVVHAFTDGRDTLPSSAPGYVAELERWLRHAGHVGTVAGRYYAMDRDRRWDRTKLAYDAIVHGDGPREASAAHAGRRLHGRAVLPVGLLHAETQRRRVRRGRRVHQRQLRRGRLLRVRELPQLLLVCGRRQGGDLPARPGERARPGRRLHGHGIDHMRDERPVQRQRPVRVPPGGDVVRCADLHGGGDLRPGVQRQRGVRAGDGHGVRPLRL